MLPLGFDQWVARHGGYVPEDFVPGENPKFGVQQVRSEIAEFVEALRFFGLHESILEIGLGWHGGTHRLWKQIFKRVVTIEADPYLVWRFRVRDLANARSIVIGNSQTLETFRKVKKIVPSVDCLFIDGDHEYDGVLRDWELYHHLVRPGGIIAFHDSVSPFGVSRFLRQLAGGMVDHKSHIIRNIVHSQNVGIAYEIKES